MIDQITLRQPDDWHLHLRDGALLESVIGYTARVFRRAIVMPNLTPPVTTIEAARNYKKRILNAVPDNLSFTPLMTAYLTDDFSAEVLEKGFDEGVFIAAKLYPANSTTNSSSGVSDIRKIDSLLETMERIDMPLLIHGEDTDPLIDIFDREAVFIDRHLQPIFKRFPKLRVVLEHITTVDAVQFVETSGFRLAATITPHHLHINRNAMFLEGFRSDFFCLPIVKREKHRLALRQAATSGKSCFFLGTDSAPHLRGAKENACACAGIFNSPYAIESYAEVFEEENSLNRLEAFCSEFGPSFYGLPVNTSSIKLVRRSCLVPENLHLGRRSQDLSIVPFHAGENLNWSFVNIEK
ncbi:dihydroorotase [Prochlorococcus sp. MIT 1223]|uniref:dihydroorotase n=1 Tax=Prochlorococcus sp. MIT 1223 TaxID=3096217 RepID=UPI002A760D8B|nr:dihydroorotase [Prochlorococcus sp. MIT 1223]